MDSSETATDNWEPGTENSCSATEQANDAKKARDGNTLGWLLEGLDEALTTSQPAVTVVSHRPVAGKRMT
jgi:hypothetical protein